ncbi:unnamed protein product [Rotaria magnacalcarata]|uniref:Cullin family profile domain-containing protein n=1 Tax=Rotaria magnacalcarata TaxID=392030 RepID=A0A820FIL4_9BILA|nr:unnamed protein product [Rotaria magnacalcarata]
MKDCNVHQTNKTLNLIDTIPINDPKTYIQIVISIDNEYSKPIQDSFDANSNLTVVHDTVTQSVQVSARYSENRIVLKFIGDKDVYEKFYGKMLAKRLVAQSSTSEDCKQLMISKLRAVCGFPFTSKLERMLQDNDASKNLTHEYRAYCKEKDVEDMDIDKNYEDSNTKMNYRIEVAENFTSNMLRININAPFKSLKEKGLNLLHGSIDFI